MKWTPEQITELKDRCMSGASNHDLAEHFCVPVTEIHAKRSRRGRCMTPETHIELDRICSEICDNCHRPYVIKDQEEMDDICAACRIPVDLANLVEKLEAAGIKSDRLVSATDEAAKRKCKPGQL